MLDYVTIGQGRLTNEFSDKPRLLGVVNAMLTPLAEVETLADQVQTQRWVDTAVGVQLDGIGYIVGETRLGRDDDDYRTAIMFRIFANTSNATPEDLIKGLRLLTTPDDIQYIEQYPATAMLFTNGPAPQVTAINEIFGYGNGTANTFQLTYNGSPLYTVANPLIYRNDWQGNQLLYATTRTNLLPNSSWAASWSNTNVSVASDAAIAPDGSPTADTVTRTSTAAAYVFENLAKAATPTQYTASIFVKKGVGNYFPFRLDGQSGSNAANVIFNLNTGTIDTAASAVGTYTGASAIIVAAGGGWYRVTLTATSGPESGVQVIYSPSTVSQQVDGGQSANGASCAVWGAQLEIGTTLTSYIPTTTSPVTVTDYTITNGLIALSSPPILGSSLSWSGSGWFPIANGNIQQIIQSLAPAAISNVAIMVSYSWATPFRFGLSSPSGELFVDSDVDYLEANGSDIQVQLNSAYSGSTFAGIAAADIDVGGFMLDVGGPTLAINSPNFDTIIGNNYQLVGVFE